MQTAQRWRPFGTTIFAEMTALAVQHDAINLSQGFPDFEGPDDIVEAAREALSRGDNQYARSMGHPELVREIADHQGRHYGLELDPMSEVVVTSGATEAIAATLVGLVDPGDEVILFEPFYDSYPAAVAMAGATPRYCTLRFPDFRLPVAELEALMGPKTRLLILNTPHNPTGKVFDEEELATLAELCRRHDVLVMADEVYEHLCYDGHRHVPIATLPGMRERTLSVSSTGKTYSFTGWKIGWATGPAELVSAVQAAHQFLTFSVATPLQLAMAHALRRHQHEYHAAFTAEYRRRRDFLVGALADWGLDVAAPQGTYFVLGDFRGLSDGDDRAFCRELIETKGVAAIPPSAFYAQDREEGRRLVRFAFCKRQATLEAAAARLRGDAASTGSGGGR